MSWDIRLSTAVLYIHNDKYGVTRPEDILQELLFVDTRDVSTND